jgi:GH15 family glucan-1,4-alpha-glucosidase
MTRYIILGNNILTILADSKYVLRELFYPLSTYNHLHASRVGIWIESSFSWFHDLNPRIEYETDSLVSKAYAEFRGVKIEINDCVDLAYEIFVRNVHVVTNKETRIFFTWDFHIYEDEIGDTCLYDPNTNSIIHYKRDRWFLFSCDVPIFQYATGYKEEGSYVGTWKDCEDGVLSGNPIAQGAVDSALSIRVFNDTRLNCWLVCGKNYGEVKKRNEYVKARGAQNILSRTRDYWKAWLFKAKDYDDIVRRSLLILASSWQNNGAVPASLDTDILRFNKDTYNYVWHRDAAFCSIALSLLGYQEYSRRLFLFTRPLFYDGSLFQKYTVDGFWGSTWQVWLPGNIPIQEDETALMLYALWVYFKKFLDVDFIKDLYRPFIKLAADFLASYVDGKNNLPLPSYDIWEERYGINFYTVACVYLGLLSAAKFAEFFGESDVKKRYLEVASRIKEGSEIFFVNDHFARSIINGKLDLTADSSTILGALFLYDAKDSKVKENKQYVEEKLKVNGGIARYENDWYFKEADKPNPWFITTLWLAQQYIAEGDLNMANEYLNWVLSKSLPTGLIPEQITPNGNYPSVSPLSWSHAELIRTFYFIKNGFDKFI